MNVKTIGIDLAKNVFQIHGVDEHGKRLFNKQLRRAQMASFFANIPPCLIGMEACASAHFWANKRHCCKVSDEAAFCLIQRPYISKTLLTRRISPRGSP
ncbi:hypothetical protein WP5S18E01_P20090 (plasmid) [Enterobacter cloacae]|nr:hypothetical protein WP5S18E01_P20090 [Enterobacter cloacae]